MPAPHRRRELSLEGVHVGPEGRHPVAGERLGDVDGFVAAHVRRREVDSALRGHALPFSSARRESIRWCNKPYPQRSHRSDGGGWLSVLPTYGPLLDDLSWNAH